MATSLFINQSKLKLIGDLKSGWEDKKNLTSFQQTNRWLPEASIRQKKRTLSAHLAVSICTREDGAGVKLEREGVRATRRKKS